MSTMSKSSGLPLYSLWIIIALSLLSGICAKFCEIYNSELNTTIDLNKLIVDNQDVVRRSKYTFRNDSMRLNLCTPLKEKCNNQDGFTICLHYQDGRQWGYATFPPNISYEDTQVTVDYPVIQSCKPYGLDIGGSAKKHYFKIFLRCDYTAYHSRPIFGLDEAKFRSCSMFMIWMTNLVCRPRTYVKCAVTHNNENYDLSSLTRYSENYDIRRRRQSSLTINVCHSVIYKGYAECSSPAGACMYDRKLEKYINLGNVQSSPVFTNEYLLLEYKNGDLCNVRNKTSGALLRYRTTIKFICSLEATDTHPEYVGLDEESCHYQAIWITSMACSREALFKYNDYKLDDCVILNPLTNSIYDLRLLMKFDHQIPDTHYLISACKPLKNNFACTSKTGICDMEYHMSLGEANSELIWEQGGPYLHYVNGSHCGSNQRYTTTIAFFCGPEKLSYQPFIIEKEECSTIIHWHTHLVCDKKVECITDDGEVNLTPLIQHKENYIVKHKHLEFHINICESLVPTQTLACKHGSAICKVQRDLNNKYVEEVSLGYPVNRPMLNDKGQIVLRYIGGSKCEIDPEKQLSTNITFSCGNEAQGYPTYIGFIECTYMFTWSTGLACKAMIGTWIPPCTVINTVFKDKYDLSILYTMKQMHYVTGKLSKKYSINICNSKNYCNGLPVCDETNDYGSLTSTIFDYTQREIKLEYSNGSICNNNDFYTSVIRLICDENADIGTPRLLLESGCNVEFEWRTATICSKEIDLEKIKKEESYDNQVMTSEELYSQGDSLI